MTNHLRRCSRSRRRHHHKNACVIVFRQICGSAYGHGLVLFSVCMCACVCYFRAHRSYINIYIYIYIYIYEDCYRFLHLPSNLVIAKIVLSDRDLIFQGNNFETFISETVRATKKIYRRTLIFAIEGRRCENCTQ